MCRSWRPVAVPDEAAHVRHRPGRCRACWAPCRVPSAGRCGECEAALAVHLSRDVRLALALDPDTTEATLAILADDREASVATAAMERLGDRRNEQLVTVGAYAEGQDW